MFNPASREKTCQATSGQTTIVPLPAPAKGILCRLIVKQTSGSNEGFELYVLDQEAPTDADLHTFVAKATVSAGTALYSNYALSAYYENRDPQPETKPRRTNAVYLALKPLGTGVKNFSVAWTAVATDVV